MIHITDAHVEGLADLTDEQRKRFRAEEGARCPGLLPLDFNGDNKQTLALILISPEKVDVVVAHQGGSGWEIKSLNHSIEVCRRSRRRRLLVW